MVKKLPMREGKKEEAEKNVHKFFSCVFEENYPTPTTGLIPT